MQGERKENLDLEKGTFSTTLCEKIFNDYTYVSKFKVCLYFEVRRQVIFLFFFTPVHIRTYVCLVEIFQKLWEVK